MQSGIPRLEIQNIEVQVLTHYKKVDEKLPKIKLVNLCSTGGGHGVATGSFHRIVNVALFPRSSPPLSLNLSLATSAAE
jgi:hypothetical protein